ncbi:MAG: AI-2E family transporter [Pirellulales bacterium]
MGEGRLRDEQVWLAVGSLMILATVALAAALVYTRDVMVPFVLAVFITAVVSPMFDFQVTRLHLPRWVAVVTTIVLVQLLLLLLGVLLIAAVQTTVRTAGDYSAQVGQLTEWVLKQLNSKHIEIDESRITAELESRLPGVVSQTAGTLMSLLSRGFLILIFVIFLLVGRNPFQQRSGIYAEIESTFRGYLTTMTSISAVTALLVGVVLWALGLQMAWLFALLVFLLNFIPSIGSIVATLLPIPVAVAQFHNLWMVLAVVGIPAAIHMGIGNIITPRVMGRGLELHPVTVLLALAFWGLLWGIVGMVLAVPMVAMLRIVLAQFDTTRGLANLLAGHLPGSPAAAIQ